MVTLAGAEGVVEQTCPQPEPLEATGDAYRWLFRNFTPGHARSPHGISISWLPEDRSSGSTLAMTLIRSGTITRTVIGPGYLVNERSPAQPSVLNTFSILFMAQLTSLRCSVNGGAMRITFSCVSLQSRPSAMSASQ